jgi:hypothetical protein
MNAIDAWAQPALTVVLLRELLLGYNPPLTLFQ